MTSMKDKNISRRSFLKLFGAGSVATAATLAGCKQGDKAGDQAAEEYKNQVEPPIGQMTYRENPKTGEKVSLLGYGMMRLPTLPDNNNEYDQEMINKQIDYALEHGLNYIDTSPVYCQGKSERCTGIALSRHKRSEYFIATKLSNFNRDYWAADKAKEMYHNSMKELQVDYIDYYLLHAVGGSMDEFKGRYVDNGIMDYLLKEREEGRIRNLGFSFHGKKTVFDEVIGLHEKYHWDFVQIELNYLDWDFADEISNNNVDASYLYEELQKRGIPAVIMEPLLGGRLSKVPDHVVAHFKQRKPEDSVASWAFRYIGSKPAVLTVLSGMTYMEHLEDNLRTYAPLEPLTEEEQNWLEGETANLIKSYPTIDCNDCNYCMPCPYGLNIPAIFVHYNKCVNKGNVPESQQAKNYEEARRAFLIGYDRSVPKLRQASHCIECRECVSHCPQQIDIPREMQRIDEFVEKLKQGTL